MTSRRLFVSITFVAYAVLTLWLTLHHEPWCDEADSWLLMRDGGVGTMLSRTGYAGTPALWYLLISPLAASGMPYEAQALLNLALAWGATLLFLTWSPFPAPLKVLFVFSYFASYEYAVLARPYALMIFLLFTIAAMWSTREEHPLRVAILVALLANTTAHGLIIAAVLGMLLLVEWRVAALCIMAGGGLLAALQLRVPADGPRVVRYIDPQTVPYAIASAFFPGFDLRLSFTFGLCVLICIVVALARRWQALLFFTITLVLLLVLFQLVWLGGLRHAGLILIIAITALWIARPRRGPAELVAYAALSFAMIFSIYTAVENWVDDSRWAYSGGKEMGRYIREHKLDGLEIAAHSPNEAKSVLVFLPGKRFWYPGMLAYGSYSTWDRAFDRANAVTTEAAVDRARRKFRGQKWLLLSNSELQLPGFELLYKNHEHVYGKPAETFFLYKPLP